MKAQVKSMKAFPVILCKAPTWFLSIAAHRASTFHDTALLSRHRLELLLRRNGTSCQHCDCPSHSHILKATIFRECIAAIPKAMENEAWSSTLLQSLHHYTLCVAISFDNMISWEGASNTAPSSQCRQRSRVLHSVFINLSYTNTHGDV